MTEPGLGGEKEDSVNMTSGGIVHLRTAPRGVGGLFKLSAPKGEADFSEAQEDDPADGAGVFLSLETEIGAELVGGVQLLDCCPEHDLQ
jgi:hypothetical protein